MRRQGPFANPAISQGIDQSQQLVQLPIPGLQRRVRPYTRVETRILAPCLGPTATREVARTCLEEGVELVERTGASDSGRPVAGQLEYTASRATVRNPMRSYSFNPAGVDCRITRSMPRSRRTSAIAWRITVSP